MSKIINENELKTLIKRDEIIKNGDVSCAEGLKYDFRLGTRFIKTGFNTPRSYDYLLEHDAAVIEPGEVVFVMTKEYVDIPLDVTVTLSEKRKLSHEGIDLLCGRNIDPGYKGYLFLGLHNISGSTFILRPGRKLVGATFSRLSQGEVVTPSKLPEPWDDFPEDLENFIKKYKPVNPIAISARLDELQTRLDRDRSDLLQKIDDLDSKIARLENKVEDKFGDFDTRMSEKLQHLDTQVSDVSERAKKIDETIVNIKVWAKVIAWVLGIGMAILTGVLSGLFSKILGLS